MKVLEGNPLQEYVKQKVVNDTSSAWVISFNSKMGDTIIFDFVQLNFLSKHFKELHVVAPYSHLLNSNKAFCYGMHLPHWNKQEIDLDGFFKELLNHLSSLIRSHMIEGDFVFIDSGSLGVWYNNYFSDAGMKPSEVGMHIAGNAMEEFLVSLAHLVEEHGASYVMWRNPCDDVTWGRNNFSFAIECQNNKMQFKSYLSDSDPELLAFVGQEVSVYKISSVIYQFVYGRSFSGDYNQDLFIKDSNSTLLPKQLNETNYVVLNLNTGSLNKRISMESLLEEFLIYFIEVIALQVSVTLVVIELEASWSDLSHKKFTSVIDRNSNNLKIVRIPSANKLDLPKIMQNAQAVYTHCSGFSHLSHILNKNVITFTVENTVEFINGKNPWAPGKSLSIRHECIREDVSALIRGSNK